MCLHILNILRVFFKGELYDSSLRPPNVFNNHPSYLYLFTSSNPLPLSLPNRFLHVLPLVQFLYGGKVGEVSPPHLVMPLTVEPTKPRLCNDDRFLNLWIVDRPFKLDRLPNLPRYVHKDSFQTVTDDKSGYDHILLTPDSRTYFGFRWGKWYFVSNTIPFGWKLSAYVYHSSGSLVSHHLRSKGIRHSLFPLY